MFYRVTEQDARVVERTYLIEADSDEEAQEILEELSGDEKTPLLVAEETVRTNCEIVNTDNADTIGMISPKV